MKNVVSKERGWSLKFTQSGYNSINIPVLGFFFCKLDILYIWTVWARHLLVQSIKGLTQPLSHTDTSLRTRKEMEILENMRCMYLIEL